MPVGRAPELYCPHCKKLVGTAPMFGQGRAYLNELITDGRHPPECPHCLRTVMHVQYWTGDLYEVRFQDVQP